MRDYIKTSIKGWIWLILIMQDKDTAELEPDCLLKVDEYGFFLHWKSEPRVSFHLSHLDPISSQRAH